MKKKNEEAPVSKDKNALPDFLQYPAKEDIYNKNKKEEQINPDDGAVISAANERDDDMNEKDFNEDESGSDLDVPGSELDDEDEKIGEEDEENNYYSLGGDNHDDLEEAKDA
jgi:hypothetical protein